MEGKPLRQRGKHLRQVNGRFQISYEKHQVQKSVKQTKAPPQTPMNNTVNFMLQALRCCHLSKQEKDKVWKKNQQTK